MRKRLVLVPGQYEIYNEATQHKITGKPDVGLPIAKLRNDNIKHRPEKIPKTTNPESLHTTHN